MKKTNKKTGLNRRKFGWMYFKRSKKIKNIAVAGLFLAVKSEDKLARVSA